MSLSCFQECADHIQYVRVVYAAAASSVHRPAVLSPMALAHRCHSSHLPAPFRCSYSLSAAYRLLWAVGSVSIVITDIRSGWRHCQNTLTAISSAARGHIPPRNPSVLSRSYRFRRVWNSVRTVPGRFIRTRMLVPTVSCRRTLVNPSTPACGVSAAAQRCNGATCAWERA